MWKSVTVVLLGMMATGLCALSYGPCRNVTTVNLATEKWRGKYFMNVMTKTEGLTCFWVDRILKYADGNSANKNIANILIAETSSRYENQTKVESSVEGKYVGPGHYRYSKELTPGRTVVLEAYWFVYNLPDLDCHFSCSNDALLKNGRGALFCESSSPDALKKNACAIKDIATKYKFDVNDLMVVDNCNCKNVPFAYKSNCQKVTIADYFKGC